jgi:putative hemolysin
MNSFFGVLTVVLYSSIAIAQPTSVNSPISPNSSDQGVAVKLIDVKNNRIFSFQQLNGILLSGADGKNYEQALASVKKQLKKRKDITKQKPFSGNPADSFCVDQMSGKLIILKDLEQLDYAICNLPDGTLVNAWDLFRNSK